MVNEHDAVLPEPSVAVQVTVVVPTTKTVPEAGLHDAVGLGQLSVGVGVVYVTVADPEPSELSNVEILAGQVIAGSCASTIVIVNEQVPGLPVVS